MLCMKEMDAQQQEKHGNTVKLPLEAGNKKGYGIKRIKKCQKYVLFGKNIDKVDNRKVCKGKQHFKQHYLRKQFCR